MRNLTHAAFRFTMALVLGLAFILMYTAPLSAGGVVGDGTPASCTEAAFVAALANGGLVTFDCGSSPHTIVLTTSKQIALDTYIRGNGRVTLSGGNATPLFQVFHSATLVLQDIILTRGQGFYGLIENFGSLHIINSQLTNSLATGSGGAIENYGQLVITSTLILGNKAMMAGGGIFNDGGWVTLSASQMISNTAPIGGGLLNATNSVATVYDSQFSGNVAPDIVLANGGGILNQGTLTLTQVFIHSNSGRRGGGLGNQGNALLNNVTFRGNSSDGDGAGIYNIGASATLTLTQVTFSNNSAGGSGGGIGNAFGTLSLTSVTLTGNSATNDGGGIDNYLGTVRLTNATISGNSSDYGAGMYNNGGDASLDFVTIADNSALHLGSLASLPGPQGQTATLRNSLVVNNASAGNCFAPTGNNQSFISGGHNLSSDATCATYLTQPTDLNGTNPLLGPLGDNGGATPTHVPDPGSPAIDHGQCLQDVATDQRGVPRPQGSACDIGAVERYATLLLYVPLVVGP